MSLPCLKSCLTPVVIGVNTDFPAAHSWQCLSLPAAQTSLLFQRHQGLPECLSDYHACPCLGLCICCCFCFARSSRKGLPGWLLGSLCHLHRWSIPRNTIQRKESSHHRGSSIIFSLHFVGLFVECLPFITRLYINSARIGTMSVLPIMIFPLPGNLGLSDAFS